MYMYMYIYIYIYINVYMVIIKHFTSWLLILLGNQVITGQKEQTIFCIAFQHLPSSDASFQQITFPEYIILQFFLHNNSVTLQ